MYSVHINVQLKIQNTYKKRSGIPHNNCESADCIYIYLYVLPYSLTSTDSIAMVIMSKIECVSYQQQRRSLSGIFEGKYGLVTLRDLFRWAERYRRSFVNEKFYDWEQLLAEDGQPNPPSLSFVLSFFVSPLIPSSPSLSLSLFFYFFFLFIDNVLSLSTCMQWCRNLFN